LGDRISAGGGCESAVTARARIGWVKFRECGELLYGKRFSLKMKGRIYWTCVRSAMLYGSETWCMREKDIAILIRTERAMMRAMCGVKTEGEEEYQGIDEHARNSRDNRYGGKREWCAMIWTCLEKG